MDSSMCLYMCLCLSVCARQLKDLTLCTKAGFQLPQNHWHTHKCVPSFQSLPCQTSDFLDMDISSRCVPSAFSYEPIVSAWAKMPRPDPIHTWDLCPPPHPPFSLSVSLHHTSLSSGQPDVAVVRTCGESGFYSHPWTFPLSNLKDAINMTRGFVSEMIWGFFPTSKVTPTRISTWLQLMSEMWMKEVGGHGGDIWMG